MNFSVIILLLFFSLQAGIWCLRLLEGPWGRRSARGTAGDFSSTTQLQNLLCWQTISWLDLPRGGGERMDGRRADYSLSSIHLAHLLWWAWKSHPILYSLTEEAKSWVNPTYPFISTSSLQWVAFGVMPWIRPNSLHKNCVYLIAWSIFQLGEIHPI